MPLLRPEASAILMHHLELASPHRNYKRLPAGETVRSEAAQVGAYFPERRLVLRPDSESTIEVSECWETADGKLSDPGQRTVRAVFLQR